MASCTRCDLPTSDQPVVDDTVDGEICCRGCLSVDRTVGAPDETAIGECEPARDGFGGGLSGRSAG